MPGKRLLQFVDEKNARGVGVVQADGEGVRRVRGYASVYEMAREALRRGSTLEQLAEEAASEEAVDYKTLLEEKRVLPPLDHPDPARCLVSLTGLTHIGSATSRDKMHAANTQQEANTDTYRMFQMGVAGGRPGQGETGVQPEWAFKGDGRCVVPPEQPLVQPSYAEDGGEEAEIAGLYVIDDKGQPWRVGFAIGNEFSDHVMENRNYLYLAHSKLRQCSYGPELWTGELPADLSGTVRIIRGGHDVWRSGFKTGEANMCHSIRNLEEHNFKYELFRRPGDVHVHFFGADSVSFGASIRTQAGDVFSVEIPALGKPLRNELRIASENGMVSVRAL